APRVLVGATSEQILFGTEVPGPQQPEMFPSDSVQHMIWEAVEPVTGVAATRTYTLGTVYSEGSAAALSVLLQAYAAAADCCNRLFSSGELAAATFSANRDEYLRRFVCSHSRLLTAPCAAIVAPSR
ncbi:unnamed protein product, partial [Polarella glacialis]